MLANVVQHRRPKKNVNIAKFNEMCSPRFHRKISAPPLNIPCSPIVTDSPSPIKSWFGNTWDKNEPYSLGEACTSFQNVAECTEEVIQILSLMKYKFEVKKGTSKNEVRILTHGIEIFIASNPKRTMNPPHFDLNAEKKRDDNTKSKGHSEIEEDDQESSLIRFINNRANKQDFDLLRKNITSRLPNAEEVLLSPTI